MMGKTQLFPPFYGKIWFSWMQNYYLYLINNFTYTFVKTFWHFMAEAEEEIFCITANMRSRTDPTYRNTLIFYWNNMIREEVVAHMNYIENILFPFDSLVAHTLKWSAILGLIFCVQCWWPRESMLWGSSVPSEFRMFKCQKTIPNPNVGILQTMMM